MPKKPSTWFSHDARVALQIRGNPPTDRGHW
jgi:hypothetical protein